jgi:arylsulfatase A-like enzyme
LFTDAAPTSLNRDLEKGVIEGRLQLPGEMRQHLVNLYDGELNYVDAEIGRLVNWMKGNDLYESSLIIVTSDHGESLGEHDFLYHMNCLYEHEIHVPLIIKYPHAHRSSQSVTDTVSLADIPNLILTALQMDRLTSSAPLISALGINRDRVSRYGSRYNQDLIAVYEKGKKYIFSPGGKIEVYDLHVDQAEENDLSSQEYEMAGRIATKLKNSTRVLKENRPAQQEDPEAAKAARERLKALGYL